MSSDRQPVLRQLTVAEREAIIGTISQRVETALRNCARTCLGCEHWQDKEETCGLHKARPPARIIAFGCSDYVDIVPF